jgi:transposase-like protein
MSLRGGRPHCLPPLPSFSSSGMSRPEIGWHLQMRKQVYMQKTVRYSEAFKLQVLRELETGRWESREAAARAYGLSGHATITYWARKYGKGHLLGKVIRVETAKEINEVKELRQRPGTVQDLRTPPGPERTLLVLEAPSPRLRRISQSVGALNPWVKLPGMDPADSERPQMRERGMPAMRNRSARSPNGRGL